jgi:5-amino-6-(5-phosphoribosylamino)uracil reductase
MRRPYVVLSAAVSIDGALDDGSPDRLILSGPADLDEVDALRAGCDAILVGAGTVRADDPRLLVRSAARRAERERRGLPRTPLRVVLSRSGTLDPGAAVFGGGPPPLVYTGRPAPGLPATVVRATDLAGVLADLHARGVRRLLVEGGAGVLHDVLARGLADELRLAVAPVFVPGPGAVRFRGAGPRARLAGVRRLEDMAVLRYSF